MACEEDAVAAIARGFEHATDTFYHTVAIGNLRHDTQLHVIDDESRALRMTHLSHGQGNVETECALHLLGSQIHCAGAGPVVGLVRVHLPIEQDFNR